MAKPPVQPEVGSEAQENPPEGFLYSWMAEGKQGIAPGLYYRLENKCYLVSSLPVPDPHTCSQFNSPCSKPTAVDLPPLPCSCTNPRFLHTCCCTSQRCRLLTFPSHLLQHFSSLRRFPELPTAISRRQTRLCRAELWLELLCPFPVTPGEDGAALGVQAVVPLPPQRERSRC